MKRTFRKYHRYLALIVCLPLFLTVITGMLVTIAREWTINIGITPSFLLKIHTGAIFGLEGIYPILDGIGLVGLIVTGLSMSGLSKRNRPTVKG